MPIRKLADHRTLPFDSPLKRLYPNGEPTIYEAYPMTASPDNFKNAVDTDRDEATLDQREWVKPGFTRIVTGGAGFGGDTSADGGAGLS